MVLENVNQIYVFHQIKNPESEAETDDERVPDFVLSNVNLETDTKKEEQVYEVG